MSITHLPQTDPVPGDAASAVRAATHLISQLTVDSAADLVSVASGELAGLAGLVIGLRAQADALLVALTLEADSRGVIAASDARTISGWLIEAAAAQGVPLTRADARAVQVVTRICALPGLTLLRETVTTARLPLTAAGIVATEFGTVRRDIDPGYWDAALGGMIDYAAGGATRAQLGELRDVLISQYGTAETLEEKAAASYARRGLTGFHRTRTGDYEATLTLDAASHAILSTALDALAAPTPTPEATGTTGGSDGTAGSSDGSGSARRAGVWDSRTPAQRRADALIDLCRHAASTGRHPRARLVVTMTFENLRDRLGFGLTTHGHPLTPETIRQVACDATIIPMVLGTDGEVLNLGRATRLASAAQVTALRERDRGCTFPGCDRPSTWCDAHHLKHWIDGGDTDLPNLALLCRHHHTVVHRHHYTAHTTPHGVTWNI